jgi:hypothetical protein
VPRTARPLCALFAGLLFAGPAPAADPDELMKYVPVPVNTVAVINVNSILTSQRAVKEGWAKKDHVEYLAGAIPVHPSIERILLAKELHPDAPGQGGAMAVVPLKAALDLEKFAKTRGGRVETVGGETVAVTANGTVGVKLAATVLGLVRTDSRQDVARLVRYAQEAKASVQHKYLNAAVHNLGIRHHVLVAVDTEDLFHPAEIRTAVARSEVLGQDKDAAAGVEAFLAKLTGVRLTADIKADGIAAEVRVDSAAPAAGVNAEFFKAFVIELLGRVGAVLEDLSAAAAKAEGNSVVLTFKLSDPELARVLALVAPPVEGVGEADVVPVAPTGVTPAATARYYKAVNAVLDDLKAQNKKAKDYTKTATWHDTAATRVETLSVLNVDPAVIEYGHGTAARLRAIAESLRGVPVEAAILQSKAYAVAYMPRVGLWSPRGGARINPWAFAGPQSVQTNLPQIREKQAAVIEQDKENRGKLWDQIDQQRSATRRAVADKYHFDPEAPPKK